MVKQTKPYQISLPNGKRVTVQGRPLSFDCLPGIELFYHKTASGDFNVSEATTGLEVTKYWSTLKEAKADVLRLANKRGLEGFQAAIKSALEVDAVPTMSIAEFGKGLRDHFSISSPGAYLDRVLMLVGKVKLDVIAFDKWLHGKFGAFEDKGQSCYDVVEEHYGAEAVAFCRLAI